MYGETIILNNKYNRKLKYGSYIKDSKTQPSSNAPSPSMTTDSDWESDCLFNESAIPRATGTPDPTIANTLGCIGYGRCIEPAAAGTPSCSNSNIRES